MSSTLLEGPASSAKFKFTQGMVLPDQIPNYMSAFDYLCVSSVAEGWPNVILEAMAMRQTGHRNRCGRKP